MTSRTLYTELDFDPPLLFGNYRSAINPLFTRPCCLRYWYLLNQTSIEPDFEIKSSHTNINSDYSSNIKINSSWIDNTVEMDFSSKIAFIFNLLDELANKRWFQFNVNRIPILSILIFDFVEAKWEIKKYERTILR